jgi:thiol-disulfide isomerase/thioredoxin
MNNYKIYKKLFFLFLILGLLSCSVKKYVISKDEKGKSVIVGKIGWEDWKKHSGWQDFDASDYSLSSDDLITFSKLDVRNIDFIIFAGSWCGDSESEVPIIYKIFRESGIGESKLRLIGVDRQKQDNEGKAMIYNITRVPTLIILRDGSEIGRIVEFPKKSWELDIIDIIK